MHGTMVSKKSDIYNVARHLGEIVAQSRSAKPALAVAAAKEALASRIDEEDANSIFGEYLRHSLGQEVDVTSNSFKANASKLRTIIRCALEHKDTLTMLERITNAHGKAQKMQEVPPLYDAIVAICRHKLDYGEASPEIIEKLIMLGMRR